jgi:amino acid adenylation domain-containing protein/non-ribosomal peptide synthase protein (TIGR01720 family)
VHLTLEGHGREPLFDDVDLSRTVGWFTSMWPLAVPLHDHGDPARAITTVKELLHGTPHHGIGHGIAGHRPTAPVSFNYLGQTRTAGGPGLFRREAPVGGDTPPTGTRPHLLDIVGAVTDGRLQLRWTYSTNVHDGATVTTLAEAYTRNLARLLDHTTSGAGRATPSDFPQAGLDQATLDLALDAFDGRRVEDLYPVSPLQAGMLFHSLFEPGGTDYFVQFGYHLEPGFDAAALRQAWDHVLDRHPILRTTFVWDDVPRPLQVVHRRWPAQLTELDWRAVPLERVTEHLQAHLATERHRGFDLRRRPPHRLDLIRLGDGTGRLVWHNHHILLDAWSEQLVLEEVRAAHRAFRSTGAPPDLPEPVPYRRYVDWLGGHDPADVTARWQTMLAGVALPTPVAVLEPDARSDPAGGSGDGELDVASLVAEVPAEVTERLRRVARRHRITVGSLVHAAWGLLLSRLGGGRDVVFGVTVAGRSGDWPGVEQAVGLLINTLPMRVSVPAEATVADWLRHVHEQLVEVRDLEHSSLVDVGRQGQAAAGRRLFDTILMFENLPQAVRRDEGGLSVMPSLTPDRTGYPLVLNASLHERLLVRLDYQPTRVTAGTAQRLVEHYRMLLDLLADDGDSDSERRLGDLAPLPPGERALVVDSFNDTAEPLPTAGRCLHQLFEEQADRTPEATAVVADGVALTYGDVEARANRLARYLIDLGVEVETSVGICVERGVDMVVAILAVLKAGGAYLPLDPDYPADRLGFMVEDTAAPVVLTQQRLAGRLAGAGSGGRIVCLDDTDEARRIAAYGATRPRTAVTPDHLSYSIYTSGSTGRPKGALIRHGGIVNYVGWMTATFPLTAGDKVLQLAGMSFDISVWEMFWPWSRGAAVVLARPDGYKDPQYIAEVMEREAITSAHLVPSMLRALLPLAADRTLALRWLFASAEALPLDVLTAWEQASPSTTFVNMYGATEVSVDSTAWWCDSSRGRVLVGQPIANQQVHVLDERGEPAPVGVPGEAFLGGASVGRGYLGRPGLTAARFVPDPFGRPGARLYRTGDLVRWLPEGQLDFLGRLDHQVKIRGFRVELGEVGSCLATHPGLDRTVVVAREDQPGQKRLVAYVVPSGSDAPTTSELRGHVRAALPDHMVPAAFVVLETLPLNPNGKIDRAALPVPAGVRPDLDAGYVAPRSATETVLAGVWGQVLGLDRVGIHDDFFELGGDSILSIQVMAAARRAGLTVTPRQVFNHPSIAALAATVDDGAAAVEAEQGTVSGEVPLTPIQRWFVSDDCPGDRYDQSVRLQWDEPVDLGALRSALAGLVAHHDALRLRLRHDPQEGWRQHIAPADDHELLQVGGPVDEVHAGLDLADGPIVQALLVEPDETVIAVHHIAVDVVSWTILLEDLATAYRQAVDGRPVDLPPKTTSYQQWARRLADHAESDGFAAEAAWWRSPRPAATPFPTDHDRGPNTYGSATTVTTAVDIGAPGGRVRDLLVTALVRTLAGHTGESTVHVHLEGHGREPLFDDVDLGRTVGWFTSLWPLTVELPDAHAGDPTRALATVEAHLHGTPHNGVGHGIAHSAAGPTAPAPPVSFNYLGRAAAGDDSSGPFRRLPGIGGDTRATATRPHLIDVTAALTDGRLEVGWTYSTNVHDRATVEALAGAFAHHVTELLVLDRGARFVDRLVPGAPALQLALHRHRVPGVGIALVAGGELVDAWGEGVADAGRGIPVRPDTAFQIGSISKHVTALAVLRLAEEGQLDLDEDVNRYLRDWQLPPADPERPVTLRHLLSHDAGVSADQFASFGGYAPDGPVPSVLDMLRGHPPAVTDPVRCEHPAGRRFRYSGNNYVVVEQVLTDLVGRPFPELMHELVLGPLDMRDSGYGPAFARRRGDAVAAGHQRDGRVIDGGWRVLPSATGGLWASAGDLARVAAEVWRAARGDGIVLRQAKTAGELLTPIRPGVDYGLGTVVRTVDGTRWVGHTGDALGFQCHTALALEPGLGLVVTTNGDAGLELVVDLLVELGLGLHVWTAREE